MSLFFWNKTYRQAAELRIALLGRTMTAIKIDRDVSLMPQLGRVIEEVRTMGRELEIIWDDGVVLRSKMRVNGSWRVLDVADMAQRTKTFGKSGTLQQVLIQVGDRIAICVGAKEIEMHHDFDPRRHPMLGQHGPDLSDKNVDIESCVDRLMGYEDADMTVAEVLLDQRVMRGIGNVFRCELLWTCELHPWAKISSLNREECRELVTIAAEMLQHKSAELNNSLAVYGRHGKSCARCSGLIQITHHGEAKRVLYWCADCQTRHAGTNSSRYVTEHDTPPGMHPAEFIYMSEIERTRNLG